MALIIPKDDYSPIYVGDTRSGLSVQAIHVNGTEDISEATITLKLRNTTTGEIKTCSGPWQRNLTQNWRAFYRYQPTDVDTPGDWEIWIDAETDGEPLHLDDGTGNPKILQILPLPSGI